MRPRRGPLCLFGVALLCACGPAHPLDALPRGETGRVVRIIDGDALVLDTGLSVRLAGIEAPAPERRNRPGAPYADQSSRLLEDMAMGRRVRLYYPGITRDRYDRALAYVRTDDALGPDLWLNMEMIRAGAARARIYPDTAMMGEVLIDTELTARQAETGLWALPAYEVLMASNMPADAQGFYLVRGELGAVEDAQDDREACRREFGAAGLRLLVRSGAAQLCDEDKSEGQVRVRGYVRDGTLEVTHTYNIEWPETKRRE